MVVFPQITYSNSSTKYKCTLVHGTRNVWTRNTQSMNSILCTGLKEIVCLIYGRNSIYRLSVLNVCSSCYHIVLFLDVYCLD